MAIKLLREQLEKKKIKTGVTVDDNINIVSDWSDTDTFHRCTFDITLGWDEENIIPIDKAHGAKISVSENTNLLDEFTIEIDKGD